MKRALVTALCIAAALMLWSCSGDTNNPAGGTTTPPAGDTTPAETTAPVEAVDLGKYTIIRADELDTDFVKYITGWRTSMNAALDTTLNIKSDWSKDNKQNNTVESGADVHEILIGDTNRAESRAAAQENSMAFGYVVKYTNGKLVIWGTDTNATIKGMDYVLDLITKGTEIMSDYSYSCDLSGEGSSIWRLATQYRIVCGSSATDREVNAAKTLKSGLGNLSGAVVSMATSKAERVEREILVGDTGLAESTAVVDTLDYMDFVITVKGSKVIVAGGSPLATERAVNMLLDKLGRGELESLEGYDYKYSFREARPDSVIWNMDAFEPVWKSEFTAPAWLLDFEQKAYGCLYQGGRMMGDAHRGDNANYPENSAEGILSAVLMGADCIEIDIRLTADGVMVLLHDESLKRTTDFASKSGKNGLPTSEKVSDWTYEQLLRLNLKSGRGGNNASVTKYKICTAYEAVRIMAGHSLIHWDCKDDRIIRDTDTYLLADELGAKANFYYYYGSDIMRKWYDYDRTDKEFGEFLDRMAAYAKAVGSRRRARNFDYIAKYGDDLSAWNHHVEDGYNMVFTNKIYDLCRYVAANCGPFEIKK